MDISRYAGAVWVAAVLVSGLVAFTGNGITYADERHESDEYRNKREDHERNERNGRRGQGPAGFPESATYRQE